MERDLGQTVPVPEEAWRAPLHRRARTPCPSWLSLACRAPYDYSCCLVKVNGRLREARGRTIKYPGPLYETQYITASRLFMSAALTSRAYLPAKATAGISRDRLFKLQPVWSRSKEVNSSHLLRYGKISKKSITSDICLYQDIYHCWKHWLTVDIPLKRTYAIIYTLVHFCT